MLKRLARLSKSVRAHWLLLKDPIDYARSIGVGIGKDCRLISVTTSTFGGEPYLVQLGDHVTITAGVRFITHDGGVWVLRDKYPDMDVVAPVKVGNNVFIGVGTIIMPGVTIGSDCVIGAGSIVTRDIPSGHVAVGVPARCIKTVKEYEEQVCEKALFIRHLDPLEKRRKMEQLLDSD